MAAQGLMLSLDVAAARRRPHVVVLGNEKGGSGKSTTAMHLIVALLRAGAKVASIDLDARQGTLTRYVENRRASAAEFDLPLPQHVALLASELDSAVMAAAKDRARFAATLGELADFDFVVIDTPGSDTGLARLGHSHADTLVTPLNDRFVDLDLLTRLDREGKHILGPSVYAEAVWEQRKRRMLADGRSTEWIVMRNRFSAIDARNKRDIGALLQDLSRRIGFRLAPGFTERVIFRELFPRGLTLLDLVHGRDGKARVGPALSMSHVAARQEVRALLQAIGIVEQAPGAGRSAVLPLEA
jgi:chromosome partitioning protein